jgi:hypothetical protein
MKDNYVTMSYECEYGQYVISVPGMEMPLSEVMERLVEPLLLAAGYHQKTIDRYFGRDD